ncbi:MAG: hypothetical protein O3C40_34290 [Planctomycetota bacterium]|nr:hypothetical protein [Planctomycetota bacterium]
MPSRTWTIVTLTLTLLIFGCSDSENAKLVAPVQSGTVGVAAALPNRTAPGSSHPGPLSPNAGGHEALEIPAGFQPPELDIPNDFPHSFGITEILVPVVRTNTDNDANSVELLGFVDALGLKSLLSETTTLKVVRLADEASDVQVVAVEAPAIMVQRGDAQIELNLFELPGFHDPKTVLNVAGKKFGGQDVRGLGATHVPGFPFGGFGPDGLPELPPLPQPRAIEETPVVFPRVNFDENPVTPEGNFEQGRDGQRSAPPFALPELDGGPEAGLPQFPQLQPMPSLPNDND